MQDRERWIWPFELQEQIGSGGMGRVYRARYVPKNTQVAVKLLPDDVQDERLMARFERELEILKTLRHPNIVRCFGGVAEGDRRFYAMELVEGGNLEELLRTSGRLTWQQTVDYGVQMCAGLEYAHKQGVVHRDVKPGNFLLAKDGHLKLSDFGLATMVAARRITAGDRTVGTFPYMPPEQIQGQPVDSRTDLYALGCVLFECLTGRPPFVGDNASEILHQHLRNAPPPVSRFAVNCPPLMQELITDLLKKDRSERPATATEVAERLEEIPIAVVVTNKKSRLEPTKGPLGDKETKAMIAAAPASPPAAAKPAARVSGWFGPAVGGLLILMLLWNLALQGDRQRLSRAERLWLDAYQGELSDDPAVQMAGARVVGKMARRSDELVEMLIEDLDDEELRLYAITGLGEAGPNAKKVKPRLERMLTREDHPYEVRSAIQTASPKMVGDSPMNWWSWMFRLTALVGVAWGAWWFYSNRKEPSV